MSCFDDKKYILDDGICTLAYFHIDSVTSCKKIEKDCDKKDCDKKIVIIEKNCYNWKNRDNWKIHVCNKTNFRSNINEVIRQF